MKRILSPQERHDWRIRVLAARLSKRMSRAEAITRLCQLAPDAQQALGRKLRQRAAEQHRIRQQQTER